ncbi:hypothetical protein DL767_005933 [Monosporascus sp. MG133]|nr:hypothetical protein DL767_005933 [Monosporascus sp. MG133]
MATIIQTFHESDQKPWAYGPNHTNGALRLVNVSSLLTPDPKISLSEWRNLRLSDGRNIPSYAAISHCWTPSPAVIRLSALANRPLDITVGPSTLHHISWHGLCQAAVAARHLGCAFLWLDFLCLHQTSSLDKRLQIQNMGHIYSNAKAVVVMPGGVAAAQDMREEAYWMSRAWTLQEATLCANTHVLALHPAIYSDKAYSCTIGSTKSASGYDFTNIQGDLALTELEVGVALQRGVMLNLRHKATGEESTFEYIAQCFGRDGCADALQVFFLASNSAMRKAAAWRCLWLRTSTKPQDMVFSVMHLLGAEIAVDYGRSLDDLILELARKTAGEPAWLDIGFEIPVNPRSGLLPSLPLFRPNQPPAYHDSNRRTVSASEYVQSGSYISKFDIRILTPMHGNVDGDWVCAAIFEAIESDSPAYIDSEDEGGSNADESSSEENSGEENSSEDEDDSDDSSEDDDSREDERGGYLARPVKVPIGSSASHVMLIGARGCEGTGGMFAFAGLAGRYLRRTGRGTWEVFGPEALLPKGRMRQGIARTHLKLGGAPGARMEACDCPRPKRSRRKDKCCVM